MILLDTCVLIFDALAPEQLSRPATNMLTAGRQAGDLACSDISLWEIAMLIHKERVRTAMPPREFLNDVIAANRLRILPISSEIACLANGHPEFTHGDPADRLIAATALHHKSPLVTCDARLLALKTIETVW